MKKLKYFIFFIILAALVFLIYSINSASKTEAQNQAGSVTGYANILNLQTGGSSSPAIFFSGSNGGSTGNMPFQVQYSPSTGLTGFAWSPIYGWIQFNGVSANVLSFQNDGESTNWATGYIDLGPNTNGGSTGSMSYDVEFDQLTGAADATNHWAWGGNVLGWIDFSNVVVSAQQDLCPTVDGIQTQYPCGPCPNYPDATSVPNGMMIDPDTGNCVTIPTEEPNLSSSTNGSTVIVWNNAEGCVAIPNALYPDWANVVLSGFGSIEIDVLTTTVFSMNCNGQNISTTVCIVGTPTPAGVVCKKPPHYIEN
jgi:hypothetical protein